MINSIIDGISVKLDEEFGGITIYSEDVQQGFKEPCFFIELLKQSKKQLVAQRYLRKHRFDIMFFPDEELEANRQMNDVAEGLLDAMEYISVDGNLVRGTGMRVEVVDNVLHFFVNFNLIVRKLPDEEPEKMEELRVIGNTMKLHIKGTMKG